MFFKKFYISFLSSKSWKNHLKKLLTLVEIPSFQKFLFYCPTAQMAEVIVQNVAYRATVYRTGVYWFKKSCQLEFFQLQTKQLTPLDKNKFIVILKCTAYFDILQK
jgi:hypothetical protein